MAYRSTDLRPHAPTWAPGTVGDYEGAVPPEFIDSSRYSADETYRWWFQSRWGDGQLLCWVGLCQRRPTFGHLATVHF